MGCEIKANPGVHLLLIFHEGVEPDQAVTFLEEIYGAPYANFSGDPAPTTAWTLQQVFEGVAAKFADRAMVIAPHVDSGGGLYEALKEFQQLRMFAFRHPALSAISFNKPETRDRVLQLLTQPDYKRSDPLALIQSSDYHGQQGLTLGQPRSEIHIPNGKATFANIREAFRIPSRVKCSCDFAQEEYDRLIKNRTVVKFQSDPGKLGFRESDLEKLAVAIGAMLNSQEGVIDLQGEPPAEQTREVYLKALLEGLSTTLKDRIDPAWRPGTASEVRLSPTRARILLRVVRSQRLHTVSGHVYVIKNGSPQRASAGEIELVVSRNINGRFGERFEDTLDEMSNESSLLAKVPRGIPIVLGAQERLIFPTSRSFKSQTSPDLGFDDRERKALIHDQYHKSSESNPLGLPSPEGNLTLPYPQRAIAPRFPEHYLRFTIQRVAAPPEFFDRVRPLKVDATTLAVYLGGGVSLVEPGHITSQMPLVLLEAVPSFAGSCYALAAWLKSAFVIWYCAVHLGNPDLFLHMQIPSSRLPFPKADRHSELFQRLDTLARNIVVDENKLMKEINKHKSRGTLDDEYLEKEINHHNSRANAVSLTIDEEIFRFLGIDDRDQMFIARALQDIRLSDFGLLTAIEKKQKAAGLLD